MFRKLLPFVLLGLILFQLLGFTVYFSFEKAKIQKQLKSYLKEGVPKDQLKHFVFSATELKALNWIKRNEFKIGENYYDVVWKKTDKNGLFNLECVDDKQETKLFKQLAHYVDFNLGNKQAGDPIKVWFSYLNQPLICNTSENISFVKINSFQTHYFAYSHFYEAVGQKIPSPPPNQIITA
jgi:hypothetical protein